jgi:hypothetical protein
METSTLNKPAASRYPRPAKAEARSRVSNGEDILPGVDGRSTIARRYRDISCAMLADMGGAEMCSESRLQLVRRFSAAAVLAEQMEATLANGGEIDIAEHCQLASTMVRLATRLGIERVPRDVTNTDMQLVEAELARLESEDSW